MRFFLVCLGFFSVILGCAHSSHLTKSKSARFYFEKAISYKNKGDNIKALENLTKIRQEFFYSPYNQKALLLTADIYFDQEKYSQSAQTYDKYQQFYSEQKDYVLYQLGLSYKNRLPARAEHDLSMAEPALSAFEQLLALKEESPYKKKALTAKQEILNKKAERELKTALFFKTQAWYQAGLKRTQYFIQHYPKSPLFPKALLTAFELAQELNQQPMAEAFKKRLLEEYPQSPSAQSLSGNSFFFLMKQKIL